MQTPIFLKTDCDVTPPPELSTCYLLTGSGLFLCRNHSFFRSCVPAPNWPSELASHKSSLELKFPRIPRVMIEEVVGFFDLVGERFGSEAAVLLVWDSEAGSLQAVVPDQRGLVGRTSNGHPYPISLEYNTPLLPPHQILLGDIHSHVRMPAFASAMDRDDELHRPGVHLVVGRLHLEPPEFHCELTVDGHRFPICELGLIVEDYQKRRSDQLPPEWMTRVRVRTWRPASQRWQDARNGGAL
jgi:PRTRC genetic system protein A